MPTAGRKPPAENPNADVAALGYEQARDELVAVVARLEAGAGSLEDSLALWERGEALATRCQQWLDGARERLAAASPAGAEPGGSAGDHDEVPGPGADEDEVDE
ncbi:MAG TPA: exodeoxyribonuclease VII small subunit [Cellulomonas sp.]